MLSAFCSSLLLISVITGGRAGEVFASDDPSATASTTCSNIAIPSITASSYDNGHPPTNAIDGNLDTYWSSSNFASITSDLGSSQTVCGVSIDWHQGDLKQYRFAISLSSDGQTFTLGGFFLTA